MVHTSPAPLVLLENVYVIFRDAVFQNGNLRIKMSKNQTMKWKYIYIKIRCEYTKTV